MRNFSLFVILLLLARPGAAFEPCRREGKDIPKVSLKLVAAGLRDPVHVANAQDGSARLFIVEQAGRVRILKDGVLLKEPFLDIRKRVKSGGEMGLLSVAFHPGYKANGRLFLNYTSSRGGGLHTVISEFAAAGDQADAGREKILLTIAQPYSNHNGGLVLFGPDGFLYVGMGDGGSGDDPHNNGQRLDTLLGKMLRIGVDRREKGKPYAIPADNPFASSGKGRPEIYAWGLRNPWRFTFDPLTRLLYAGDVGQNRWEEIDVIEKGKNYGWRVMEGRRCNVGVDPACDERGLELPIIDYGRREGISVTGGEVYRGGRLPGLCGVYVYGDFGDGSIWGLRYDRAARKVAAQGLINASGLSISSFGRDERGELYVADLGGKIFRVDEGH